MQAIHAFCLTPACARELQHRFSRRYELHCYDTAEVLFAHSVTRRQGIILVELRITHAEMVLGAIRKLYQMTPLTPIIGYGDLNSAEGGRLVQDASIAGMSKLMTTDVEDLRNPQWVFDMASAAMIARWLRPEISRIPDAIAATFCHCSLMNVFYDITVQSVASRLHVEPHNVSRAFRRLSMPAPRSFIAEIRALLAVYLLSDHARRAHDVAESMRFTDEKALRRLLAVRATPSFVRDRTVDTFPGMLDGIRVMLQRAQNQQSGPLRQPHLSRLVSFT